MRSWTFRRLFSLASLAMLALPAACSSDPASSVSTTQASSSSAATGAGGEAASGTGGGGGAASGTGGSTLESPEKPADLVDYLTGEDADADVQPTGPGLILMGGGTDVDEAFQWWKGYLAGGDVVVLRTSGEDGYNDYLYTDIGGCDSVETMLVTTRELADSGYVAWRIRHAEGVFLAGGDQATYMTAWKDSAVEAALQDAYARGAVVGGTSAGCAVLGELVFAAYNDTVYSDQALADPYNDAMQMDRDFLALPALHGILTDTHFAQRDRMGRLVAFVARVVKDGWAEQAMGIGVDEETALVVDPTGQGKVLGNGAVYVVKSNGEPAVCQAGQPLDYDVMYSKLPAGSTITLPSGETSAPAMSLSAANGVLSPADPY